MSDTEIAWAAGFFDGEGCTAQHTKGYIRIYISQKGRECLDRFRESVGGLGNVYGPDKRGIYAYAVSRRETVFAVLNILWPYLSTPKREQAVSKGFNLPS